MQEYCECFCDGSTFQAPALGLYQYKLVTIFHYTPPILSFRCDATEDGGGVHPFGTTFFVNFESDTGKAVAVADLLKEGALPKLSPLRKGSFGGITKSPRRRAFRNRATDSLMTASG